MKYDKCSQCGRLTTEGIVCDVCFDKIEAATDDVLTIEEMDNAALCHVMSEYDARAVLGLQLVL